MKIRAKRHVKEREVNFEAQVTLLVSGRDKARVEAAAQFFTTVFGWSGNHRDGTLIVLKSAPLTRRRK